MMKIVFTHGASIQLRTMEEDDRRAIMETCESLEHWKNDAMLRSRARRVNLPENDHTFMLSATPDFRIFFRVENNRITVIDLATERMLQAVARSK